MNAQDLEVNCFENCFSNAWLPHCVWEFVLVLEHALVLWLSAGCWLTEVCKLCWDNLRRAMTMSNCHPLRRACAQLLCRCGDCVCVCVHFTLFYAVLSFLNLLWHVSWVFGWHGEVCAQRFATMNMSWHNYVESEQVKAQSHPTSQELTAQTLSHLRLPTLHTIWKHIVPTGWIMSAKVSDAAILKVMESAWITSSRNINNQQWCWFTISTQVPW